MASPSIIGALRVILGADTAQFTKGMMSAQSKLTGFQKLAVTAGAAIGTALVAMAGKIAFSVLDMIDKIEKLEETSQKIGVPVEQLSRLQYAAEITGAGVETLTAGLAKLSRGMLQTVEKGTGPASEAFETLGINVKNADGTLRSSEEVFFALADKFAGMEDGAKKTALAIKLFKGAGVELIPVLNAGGDRLRALAKESDDFGITIRGDTAKAVDEYKENMTRLTRAGEGLAVAIVNTIAPTLVEFTEVVLNLNRKWIDLKASLLGVASNTPTVAAFFETVKQRALDAINPLNDLVYAWRLVKQLSSESKTASKDGLPEFSAPAKLVTAVEELKDVGATETFNAITVSTTSLSKAIGGEDGLNDAIQEGKALFEQTRTPSEALGLQMQNLNTLLASGVITWDTYNRAVFQAQDEFLGITDKAMMFGDVMANGLQRIIEGTGTLKDMLGDLQSTLTRMLISKGFEMLIQLVLGGMTGGGSMLLGGLGGGGMLSGLTSLLGFAAGGSFQVGGGMGGRDRPYMIGLTPGETVDIKPAGEEYRNPGGTAVIEIRGFNPKDFYQGAQIEALFDALNGHLGRGAKLNIR